LVCFEGEDVMVDAGAGGSEGVGAEIEGVGLEGFLVRQDVIGGLIVEGAEVEVAELVVDEAAEFDLLELEVRLGGLGLHLHVQQAGQQHANG